MKTHLTIDGRSKDKLTAQQVGIHAAQESFKKSLKKRNFLFSWDDEPIMLSVVLKELHMHYAKVPDDMTSLQDVVKESCLIEYANLKEKYKKPLPVSNYTDAEIIACFVDAVTYDILKDRKTSNFSNFLQNFNAFDDMSLPKIVEQSYPIDELKKQASTLLDNLFEKKSVSIELQETIRTSVDNFWKNFNILPSFK